jgi:hypothetical protein
MESNPRAAPLYKCALPPLADPLLKQDLKTVSESRTHVSVSSASAVRFRDGYQYTLGLQADSRTD